MSVFVDVAVDKAVAMGEGVVDGVVETLDATQNAVLESGVNAATLAEALGDDTMDAIKEQADILKTMLTSYGAAIKKVAGGLPLP